jgi:hypothetical protein
MRAGAIPKGPAFVIQAKFLIALKRLRTFCPESVSGMWFVVRRQAGQWSLRLNGWLPWLWTE